MERLIDALRRQNPPDTLCGRRILWNADYKAGVRRTAAGEESPTGLPSSNVMRFCYEGGVTVTVRPSGTEPKLKIYYSLRGDTLAEARGAGGAVPRRFRKHPLGPAVGMTRPRVFFEALSRRTRTCGQQDASLSFVCNIAASHATKLPVVPQRDLVAGTARQRESSPVGGPERAARRALDLLRHRRHTRKWVSIDATDAA